MKTQESIRLLNFFVKFEVYIQIMNNHKSVHIGFNIFEVKKWCFLRKYRENDIFRQVKCGTMACGKVCGKCA